MVIKNLVAKKRVALFVIIAFFASCMPHVVFSENEPPSPTVQSSVGRNKISLDIKGMDIVDILKMLATRAGLNLVVGKNVTGRVTLFLKDVDSWDAFEITLLANDLAYDQKGDIINVMTQRDYELQYGERFKDKKQAKIIQLQYAKAADLSRALNQIKTNLGRIVVDESSNTLALIDTPDKITEMENFIKNTDLPVETKMFTLNYAVAEKLQPKLQEAVTKGVGSVRSDERTNKIAVTDFPNRIKEISDIITAFDAKPGQVLIDAQIVEIAPNKDEFTMGVDWDYWIKSNARLLTSLPAPSLTSASTIPDILYFGLAARDANWIPGQVGYYKSLVDALRVIGETKILSSPRIMAINNQEAKILVGTKDAYITSTTSVSSGSPSVTSQNVNFVDVGIKLYVTPTINEQKFITMKIKPEISSSTRTSITSQNQSTQIPIVTTSEAETTIMVKDGTTIMIAGLKKDQQDSEIKKIPILGDIPIIKLAFQSQKKEKRKTELVIFITPHIVSGAEAVTYSSLTNDKDILNIRDTALARQTDSIIRTSGSFDSYKRSVFQKINMATLSMDKLIARPKGRVEVAFTLNSQGELKHEPTVLSSTDQALNAMSIDCVKKASPFAPLPRDLNKEEESFKIDLSYE
ncbi:MAG: hypothetical protein KBA46_07470 [Candidatus Omnitrophica bacterium]|nr:hypothetical protein [Candidatus Omnitrophota bacterium]